MTPDIWYELADRAMRLTHTTDPDWNWRWLNVAAYCRRRGRGILRR